MAPPENANLSYCSSGAIKKKTIFSVIVMLFLIVRWFNMLDMLTVPLLDPVVLANGTSNDKNDSGVVRQDYYNISKQRLLDPAALANNETTSNTTSSYYTDDDKNHSSVALRRRQPIVYIAGRYTGPEKQKGDGGIIDELHLSVRSACYATARLHRSNSTTSTNSTTNNSTTQVQISEKRLDFVIFISEADYDICTNSSAAAMDLDHKCDYSIVERSCRDELPTATFEYVALDAQILNLWREHAGVVSFGHHSTWYGYTKLWLPVLLGNNDYSSALFVDTDTIWNRPPSILFDELHRFNSTQVIGASSLMGKLTQSFSFANRITSGVLLMDLEKIRRNLDWIGIVKHSIVSNRGGIGTDEPIPNGYNMSDHCEKAHAWGKYSKPVCVVVPQTEYDGCNNTSRPCWHADVGDQEIFSNIFSNFNPELLYLIDGGGTATPRRLPSKHQHQCIKMGPFKDKLIQCKGSTLIHAPQVPNLWQRVTKEKGFLPDELLAGILPSVVYVSVNWFRVHIKNITVVGMDGIDKGSDLQGDLTPDELIKRILGQNRSAW
mmetsp:Transcript_2973/g.7533  ORF Transcript_2973/g.7533 Transcript_2973/m.7533 type:complete len:549 (-) Transcript_2973:46-1692(-)